MFPESKLVDVQDCTGYHYLQDKRLIY